MDKKEESVKESVNRFRNIMEYIEVGGKLEEAGEDDPMAPDAGMPDSMGDGQEAQPEMAPEDDGGQEGVEGFAPQEVPEEEDDEDEDEEVIDVDDLTDAQEDTEKKVSKLSRKFDKLLGMIDKFETHLDDNSQSMMNLRAEIEKRNLTPEEKLNLRSKDGYPFNVSVDDYWRDKEATSNYSPDEDNNGEDSEIYKITKDDIDGISDWNNISKSLDDDEYHMSLKDIIDY